MTDKHTYHDFDASGMLPEASRVNPYTVPDGYFDDLSRRIAQRCSHIEESKAAFSVPPDYFGQLEQRIGAKIAEARLRSLVSESGFTVPEGYFDDLKQRILLVQELHARVESPGFAVPADYFSSLERNILDRTVNSDSTPVRNLRPAKWAAYAAAACIAFVAGIIGFFQFNGSEQAPAASPLAAVPDQEIINYLELYGAGNDIIYISEQLEDFQERNIGEGLSEDDIEAYLNNTL